MNDIKPGEVKIAASDCLETAQNMDKLGRLSPAEKAFGWKMLTQIMSARQMDVHYIYITYFRVTEIEVVKYLLIIPPLQLAAHACMQSILISSAAL